MPPSRWKTLSSRPIYANAWISVREDLAETPSGKQTIYGVITMNDAVGVLPFLDDDRVVLVRQYRYPHAENHRWEIPTGGVKAGEEVVAAAQRELREETGYQASDLALIHTFHTSNAVLHETAHIYIARGLTPAPLPPDETEDLEVEAFRFSEVLQMVKRSEIRDSLSVIAVLLAHA